MSDLIVTENHGAVRLLRLNRPAVRNALSVALCAELARAVGTADLDPDVRAIVLTGDQAAFSAGGDIKEIGARSVVELMAADLQRNWLPLMHCATPLLAAVNGYALGGGFELALHCDVIVAGVSAVFALPEIRIGIMPGAGGTQRLVRAAGKYKAMRYAMTGDRFSAAEAERMGLVSELVADDAVLARTLALAGEIAALPPYAVRQIKGVVLAGMDASLPTALLLERTAHITLSATEDKREGTRAFLEKRPARFSGR